MPGLPNVRNMIVTSIRELSPLLRPADVAEDVTLHAFKTGYRHVGML